MGRPPSGRPARFGPGPWPRRGLERLQTSGPSGPRSGAEPPAGSQNGASSSISASASSWSRSGGRSWPSPCSSSCPSEDLELGTGEHRGVGAHQLPQLPLDRHAARGGGRGHRSTRRRRSRAGRTRTRPGCSPGSSPGSTPRAARAACAQVGSSAGVSWRSCPGWPASRAGFGGAEVVGHGDLPEVLGLGVDVGAGARVSVVPGCRVECLRRARAVEQVEQPHDGGLSGDERERRGPRRGAAQETAAGPGPRVGAGPGWDQKGGSSQYPPPSDAAPTGAAAQGSLAGWPPGAATTGGAALPERLVLVTVAVA